MMYDMYQQKWTGVLSSGSGSRSVSLSLSLSLSKENREKMRKWNGKWLLFVLRKSPFEE